MNKKYKPLILGVLVLLLVGGGIFAFTKLRGDQTKTTETTTKKKVAVAVNTIPVNERPYIQVQPTADGRNINLRFMTVKKQANSVEYEVEYQTGTLLQGFSGLLQLDTLPAEDKKLLGSCSAGGACTYHEDIQGGNLTATFEGGETYAVKSDWRYFDNKAKGVEFSSKDAKFQLSSPDLKNTRYVVVYNSPGFPGELPSTLASDLYTVAVSGTPTTGKAQLSIRANEEGNLTIVGWNGTKWLTFETTTEGKTATATVDLVELYAVVKSTEGN